MKHAAYRIFKKPFFGQFMKPWRWPEQAEKDHWERMDVPSESGAVLSAMVAEAYTEKAKGAVLLAHPMGAVAKGFWVKYGHAELLRQAGYHVMVFDLNGFGESTNTTMDYPLDVLAAGQALQSKYPELPIAVLGASMGAAMTMCAMSHLGHPFKAAVLESAFPTLLHFWRRYPIPKLGIKLSQVVYPAGEKRLRPILAADRLVGTPSIFLIYGEKDVFTPVKDGRILENALKDKTDTQFWTVPGAEHTHAYRSQPEAYAEKVIRFLDENLVSTSQSTMRTQKAQGEN